MSRTSQLCCGKESWYSEEIALQLTPKSRTPFDRYMNSLTDKTDEQLQQMQAQINQALREVAEKLDEDETLVEAVKTLLRSESVLEDYTTLLVSEPEIIKQLIGNSLSALVNVHLMVTIGDELKRRAEVN